MDFNIENVIATISSVGAILLVLYVIGNFIFHIMINDKIVRVTGYELKSVNITLATLIIMFISGSSIGCILEIGGMYVSLITVIILGVFNLAIEKYKIPKFIKATYSTQIIVCFFSPIIVGGVSGGSLKDVVKLYRSDMVIAGVNLVCILLLLISTILLVGRYWGEKFQSNKRVKVKGADFEQDGILLAEKDSDVFFEIDGKMHRIKKDHIMSIEQL